MNIETLNDPIFWIDIETTGLDPDKDEILEVAVVVTNGLWNVVDSFTGIFPPTEAGQKRLDENGYVRNMHDSSGLTEDLAGLGAGAPTFAEAQSQVEERIVEALSLFEGDSKFLIAGSSVHFDRKFLDAYMNAEFMRKHFGYRLIDASTVREVARREDSWRLDLTSDKPDKTHRAYDDIINSIHTLAACYGYSIAFVNALPQDWAEVVEKHGKPKPVMIVS